MKTEAIIIACEPLLVGRKDAAALLGISERALIAAENCGKIGPQPTKLAGNRVLYNYAELKSWASQGMPPRGQWRWEGGK